MADHLLSVDEEIARDGRQSCIREGGSVKRWHTRPVIGEQTVASHTWGVMVLIDQMFPNASKELLRAALYHDVAEFFTGDIPADAKWREPRLKELLDGLTDEADVRLGINHHLNVKDTARLALADRMEMLWFCLEQRNLGNKRFDLVFSRVASWFNFNHKISKLDLDEIYRVEDMLGYLTKQYSEACK